jgi:hypothetical protein
MSTIKKLSQKINNFISEIILHAVYYLGIGTTSLISKLVRKEFLKLTPKRFNWETPTGSENKDKMY